MAQDTENVDKFYSEIVDKSFIKKGDLNYPQQIFEYEYYEQYKKSGIEFIVSPSLESRGNLFYVNSSFSSLVFERSNTFRIENGYKRTLPSDGIEVHSTTWSGKWNISEDTIALVLMDIKLNMPSKLLHGLKFPEENCNNINETYKFRYKIDGATLRLYPLFNKDIIYDKLVSAIDEYEKDNFNRSKGSRLEIVLPLILSNSYSNLSAYSVQQLSEKMEQSHTDSLLRPACTAFMRDMVTQWYEGKSGLSIVPPLKIKRSACVGKWYFANGTKCFLDIIQGIPSEIKTIRLDRNFIAQNMDQTREERLELDLGKDGTFLIKDIVLFAFPNSDRLPTSITTEYVGKWELDYDKLTFKCNLNRYYQGASRNDIEENTYSATYTAKINIIGGLLLMSATPLPDYYRYLKQQIVSIKEGKTNSFYLGNIDAIVDPQCTLSAYEFSTMKRLFSQMAGFTGQDRQSAIDEIEKIIDKWHMGYSDN